jgi:hypothetical protein
VVLTAAPGTATAGTSGSTPLVTSPTSPVVDLGPPNRAGNGDLTDFWGMGVGLLVILGVIAAVRLAFRGTGTVSEGERDGGTAGGSAVGAGGPG